MRMLLLPIAALVLGGCASAGSAPAPAAVAAVAEAPPSDGCPAIRDEIASNPDVPVDRPAAPLKMAPAPVRKPVPWQVLRADRTPELIITVVVDTLGKPDMKTFTVVKSSHKWYTDGARRAIARWSFAPAEHRGCKVVRPYRFAFTTKTN